MDGFAEPSRVERRVRDPLGPFTTTVNVVARAEATERGGEVHVRDYDFPGLADGHAVLVDHACCTAVDRDQDQPELFGHVLDARLAPPVTVVGPFKRDEPPASERGLADAQASLHAGQALLSNARDASLSSRTTTMQDYVDVARTSTGCTASYREGGSRGCREWSAGPAGSSWGRTGRPPP